WLLLLLAVVVTGLYWRRRAAWLGAGLAVIAGLTWSSAEMAQVEASLLPANLVGQPVELVGRITGLVETGERFGRPLRRFRLAVESCRLENGTFCPETALSTVQLNLYSDVQLRPDERWRLQARLKRPHGFANPGGFDYETWLVAQRVAATGSVSSSAARERL